MRTSHPALLAAVLLIAIHSDLFAITFTTLNFPGATYTDLTAIEGDKIVGSYIDTDGQWHGFLYDGGVWGTLDVPFPRNPPDPFPLAYQTRPLGISGDRIVGEYYPGPRAFLFEGGLGGGAWTPLDGDSWGTAYDVDGTQIVGFFSSQGAALYDGVNWTSLAYPGSVFTVPLGIDDGRVVGFYETRPFDFVTQTPRHGFLYDNGVWTTLDYPGSIVTEIHGIDGNRMVGTWWDSERSHGFIYDGATWTSFDYPGGVGTLPCDISGNRIVGIYFDAETFSSRNFLATIPEPGGLALATLALVALVRRRPLPRSNPFGR